MVIVDTTVWIDYLGGELTPQTGWLDRELQNQRLGLTDVILCEVLQGIEGRPPLGGSVSPPEIRGVPYRRHRPRNCRSPKLQNLTPTRLHRSQDYRLLDCYFLSNLWAHAPAARPRLRCVREGAGAASGASLGRRALRSRADRCVRPI